MGAPYEGGFIHTPSSTKNRQPPLWDGCLFLVREAGLEPARPE